MRHPLTRLKIAVLAPIPKRQGEHRHRREAGILGQHAHAEAKVLKQGVDEAHAPGVAAFFLDLLDAAKTAQRRVAGFLRAHPRRNVLLDLLFQMERQLVGEFLVEFLFPEQRAQTTEEFHSDLPLRTKIPPRLSSGCLRTRA